MNIKPAAITQLAMLLATSIAFSVTIQAQTTANWTGGGGNTDWNNTTNWDIGTPAEGTNAVISGGVIVDYNAPMTATSFAGVNNSGALNISAAGFNIDALGLAAYTGNAASLLRVNSSGVVVATNSGTIALATGSEIAVEGGVLVITNSTGNITFGVNGNFSGAGFTNNGGTVIFSQPFQSRGRFSRFVMNGGTLNFSSSGTNGIFETSNDQERQFLINGGTVNLGNFAIGRTLNTVAGGGLVISNGTVNATTLLVGNGIAAGGATIAGGVLTNTGTFTIADRPNAANSGQRRVFLYVRGGSVYSTDPSGIVIAPQANNTFAAASVFGGFLDINSGLVVAEKLTLVGPNAVTNAHATLTLAGSGALYLGSGGLVGNVGFSNTSYTVTFSGGTLGAKDNYAINANMTLSGTTPTIQAADLGGNPFNITQNGILSGSGALNKTGSGTLTFNTNNTYSGNTVISAGTLALGATGSISNSTSVTVAGGASFDASASGFTLASGRTLSGSGAIAGNIAASSGSTISPGSSAGTLTFSGNLTQSGGVINNFELSAATNDLINVVGTLNISGINPVLISALGAGIPAGTYTLFQYGTLIGTTANFSLSGAPGYLTNDTTAKTISLVTTGVRASASVAWLGSPTANDFWDVLVSTNWLNGGAPDFFVQGDNVLFDSTGSANPVVNLTAAVVNPGSVTVDAATGYTFGGSGRIGGTGGLTKTNTGTLTILTTNSYTGVTTVAGGVLEVSTLANGGANSGIGAAPSGAANLVIDGGTLAYLGGTASTDHGATLNNGGGTFGVTNSTSALTIGGTVTGSGALIKTGPGTLILSVGNNYSAGTVISNGVLQFNNATGAGAGGITNAGGTLRFNTALTVNNALNFEGASKLEFSGVAGGNIALRGAWSGGGTVDVNFLTQNAAQTFSIGGEGSDGGTMSNFFGTVNFGTNTGFVRLNNNETFNLGSSNATFNLGTGNLLFSQRNGNTTTHLGALSGGPNTKLAGSRSDVPGPETYMIGGNNLSTTFDGMITNGNAASSTAVIVKVGTGTLTLGGASPYTGPTTISSGVLAFAGNGSIFATPAIHLFPGAAINSSARTDGTFILNSGQTLDGGGTIQGSLIVSSNSTLSPGDANAVFDNPVSQLVVTNALVLNAGSVLNMEVDFFTPTNDMIVGMSSVTYGGTLNLSLNNSLTNGQGIKLFNAASYAGSFETISPSTPGANLVWDQSSLRANGTLTATYPRPGVTSVVQSGTDLIVTGTNGIGGGQYYVLTSTNVALPITTWVPIATNTFESDGSFNFTNTISSGNPQQFYLLQIVIP